MIYLFYGTDEFAIQKELQKLEKKYHISDIDISKYDLETSSLDDILEDASTVSFFHPMKMILVNNAYLFANATKKSLPEIDPTKFLAYLKNPNPDCQLIFINEKINATKKVTKQVKSLGVLKEFTKSNDVTRQVKELFDGYQIDPATIRLLIERVGTDMQLLDQECEKLKMFQYETKQIHQQDVVELTMKSIDLDIFKLIDNIINRRKDQAIATYHEMLKLNEEPIKIIVMLANQFRLMYQAKNLIQKGYTESLIAANLDVHPYPVKLALQKSRNYDTNLLLEILDKLADLDLAIKQGKLEKKMALELFILEL